MGYKKVVRKLLGELLIEKGVINKRQLEEALEEHKESGNLLGAILIEKGYAREIDIAEALAAQYGIPYLPVKQHEANVELLKLLPRELALRYRCFPVDRIGSVLTVATDNPLDARAGEALSEATGLKILFFVSTMSEIMNAIGEHYRALGEEAPAREVQAPADEAENIHVFQLEDNGTSKE